MAYPRIIQASDADEEPVFSSSGSSPGELPNSWAMRPEHNAGAVYSQHNLSMYPTPIPFRPNTAAYYQTPQPPTAATVQLPSQAVRLQPRPPLNGPLNGNLHGSSYNSLPRATQLPLLTRGNMPQSLFDYPAAAEPAYMVAPSPARTPYTGPVPVPVRQAFVSSSPSNRYSARDRMLDYAGYFGMRTAPSPLMRLPPQVWRHVQSFVGDYDTLMQLRQQSRWLRDSVDPQLASQDSKEALLARAVDYPRHHPKGSDRRGDLEKQGLALPDQGFFPCYFCYRMKAPEFFERYDHQKDKDREKARRQHGAGSSRARAKAAASAAGARTGRASHRSPSPRVLGMLAPRVDADPVRRASVGSNSTASSSLSLGGSPGTPAPAALAGTSSTDASSTSRTPARMLRRFCMECGLERGFYGVKDTVENRLCQKFWVCRCRQFRTGSEPKCNYCGLGQPYRKAEEF